MIAVFLLSQAADLLTFLGAVTYCPHLVVYEVGPIGSVYVAGGPAAAILWKGLLAVGFVWALSIGATKHRTAARIFMAAGIFMGALGALVNTQAWMGPCV